MSLRFNYIDKLNKRGVHFTSQSHIHNFITCKTHSCYSSLGRETESKTNRRNQLSSHIKHHRMITIRQKRLMTSKFSIHVIRRFNSTFKEAPRMNPVGIQYLSKALDKRVFPSKKKTIPTAEEQELVNLSKEYLDKHGLLGKTTKITEPVTFNIPKLEGSTLDEHFRRIASFASLPYEEPARSLANGGLPKRPQKWLMKSGWYKYANDGSKPVKVEYPEENALVFDVETLYKVSNYPVMAVAASTKAWYGWVSPILTGESSSFEHLIPLNTLKEEKVIVGHNVGYDRARVKEEYDLKETKAFYLDTMALHISVSGMCSQQRAKWMQHKKLASAEDFDIEEVAQSKIDDPWVSYSSPNSLADVSQFYFNEKVDKTIRDHFSGEDVEDIKAHFQELIGYCANDVSATHKIYSHVFPEFRRVCPHPVSFSALRFMGSCILPTDRQWYDYIKSAEELYQSNRKRVDDKLIELVNEALKLKDNMELVKNDPWLSQLDWTITPLKIKKDGTPYKNQRLPGYPAWYKDLYSSKEDKVILTTRTRIAPLLLKLRFEGYPVIWNDEYGWCFRAEEDDYDRLVKKNYVLEASFDDQDKNVMSGLANRPESIDKYYYFRVPNSRGPGYRTTLLLAKTFAISFEKGLMNSDLTLAQEAINLNASCSYWISARERIKSQFVVDKTKDYSLIVPQVVTMGTITRRAVEKTWLTASNAKKTRIGSELKSKIRAPPGYCFVGADVDSEELWIASLVGDATFKMHGATAIGWMTLEGAKAEGTDLHSKTANILGITRNDAKVFNYGRIYGAGVNFATTLLKQFNPELSDEECSIRAKNLYAETKGQTLHFTIDKVKHKLWYGGSESVLFNELERIANQENPKTPVLGAGITKALMKKNLNLSSNSFLPSRVNWAIQSSGVDYLHLLCVSMNYLIKKYNINARLSLSVHDEIRFLVKEEDKYRAAIALQISNVWTRAIFSENLGIQELPQSCAFFSAVDIDHILRKEVDMDCITPSNPNPEKPGESLDIVQLLARDDYSLGRASKVAIPELPIVEKTSDHDELVNYKYSHQNPEFKKILLKMQISQDTYRVKNFFNDYKKNYGKLEFRDVMTGELVPKSTAKKSRVFKVKELRAEKSNQCASNDTSSNVKSSRIVATKKAALKKVTKKLQSSKVIDNPPSPQLDYLSEEYIESLTSNLQDDTNQTAYSNPQNVDSLLLGYPDLESFMKKSVSHPREKKQNVVKKGYSPEVVDSFFSMQPKIKKYNV